MPEDKGYEVNDKRKVKADEGLFADKAGTKAAPEAPKEDVLLPSIDFISFIGSLGATALMHMGERLSPDQPQTVRDLPAARQMIDLIDLLKGKTRGNLTKEENNAFENMLYNLRLLYVREAKKGK